MSPTNGDRWGALRTAAKGVGMRTAGWLGQGLDRLLGDRAEGALGILTYHRVARRPARLARPTHNVTPERFREQVSGLLERGFRIWPLARVLERRSGPDLPPHTLVMTFDDGYESFHANAWPVLRELEVPATLFLATAFLDGDRPFPFDAWGRSHQDRIPPASHRPLRTEQCREMAASGLVELGSHTHTHTDFRGRPGEFARDLEASLEVLRTRFGAEGVPFAFPYGSPRLGYASPALVAEARRAGVSCALSTESVLVDPRTDPFSWGRFNVFPWDTSATLAAKLEGWYSWGPKVWQRVTRAVTPRAAAPR